LVSFDDHYDLIDKDIKSEREAEKILSAYYRELDIQKVDEYPSSKKIIYPNLFSFLLEEIIFIYLKSF